MCTLGHGSKTGDRCAFDMYTCKGGGGREVYEPRFTYHGFRFAQLEGLPAPGGAAAPGFAWSLSARVVHSDVEAGASLSFRGAAAPALNQLQSNIRWTQLDNLHSVPTDCHQRTERQGWMADASVSAEQATLNFNMAPFYRNWLRSIVDVQRDYPSLDPLDTRGCRNPYPHAAGNYSCAGAVTDTVPHPPGTFGARPADPSWSAGFDLLYWYALRYGGDLATANATYPALRSYVDFMLRLAAADESGLLRWATTGDWLEQNPGHASNWRPKIRDEMSSAFNTALSVRVLADAAAALGRGADAHKYSAVLADQRQRWHATFFAAPPAPTPPPPPPLTEQCGQFVHSTMAGCKLCPNGGCCCPLPQFPGGCTFWRERSLSGSDKLHFVSNCRVFPSTCGAAQRACWPDVGPGLPLHELAADAMRALPLLANFSCSMRTACLAPTPAPAPTPTPAPAPAPTYGDGSQAALAYTLFLDAAPTPALQAATLAQLEARIAADGRTPTTGIIATKWLPEALSRAGRSRTALDMLLQPDAPGWLDQLAHNATTVWENWEYMVGPGMNSHAHPALTSVGAWMWRFLGGIRVAEEPAERGYASGFGFVTLAPYDAVADDHARVSAAAAVLPTARGNVTLAWAWDDTARALSINATLPVNTAGDVVVPGGRWRLLSEGGVALWRRADAPGAVGAVEGVGAVRADAGDSSLRVGIGSGSYIFVAHL